MPNFSIGASGILGGASCPTCNQPLTPVAARDPLPLIPDAVYGALSSYAQGGPAAQVHRDMPSGWKAILNGAKHGIEVIAPDGRVHYIPNGDF